jgi:hypothetical protein
VIWLLAVGSLSVEEKSGIFKLVYIKKKCIFAAQKFEVQV